ncbi:MAG: hypothetical protein H0W86_14470, partial [Armatimonadetes bacterium]|nr:hypothetical protein [Armatimonadota bacterium]
MVKSTQRSPTVDIARAYADRLVLQGIANVESTLRLGELAAELAPHGINLAGLRNLLATNPDRFAYSDRRWMPTSRVTGADGPLNQQVKSTLHGFGAPVSVSDLAAELSRSRKLSQEYFESKLPAILGADPQMFITCSGHAGLAKWLFLADGEKPEQALYLNGITEQDVASVEKILAKLDYSNVGKAAKEALKHAPVSVKLIGYFAWKHLNPETDYARRYYDALELLDALYAVPGFVFGADSKMHPEAEAPKWLKAALREAEKAKPVVEVEDVAPLEFGDVEVDEMVQAVMASPISVGVGKFLETKYELTSADRTYPEDLANAVAALEASDKVWFVGGDRFRKSDSAPEFIGSVPEFFNYVDYDFRDADGESIDMELSDDGFSSALRKEMANVLAQDVLDEDPQPKPKKQLDQLRLVLKSLHREIGTFPLCQVPTGWLEEAPSIQELIFRDSAGRELNVWLNHDTRLMFNLIDWWFEQPVESGAAFTLTKTAEPNVFDFEWISDPDPLIYISSDRMEQLRTLAAGSSELSTYEIVREV